MTRTYEVIWADVAAQDLKDIIAYIAAHSPDQAVKILHTIKGKVTSLQNLPERGRLVPELCDEGIMIYRELISPPWRIIYRLAETSVLVLAVLDSRRNIEDILFKRLIYHT
jgi:toxin ParE1/3/4